MLCYSYFTGLKNLFQSQNTIYNLNSQHAWSPKCFSNYFGIQKKTEAQQFDDQNVAIQMSKTEVFDICIAMLWTAVM